MLLTLSIIHCSGSLPTTDITELIMYKSTNVHFPSFQKMETCQVLYLLQPTSEHQDPAQEDDQYNAHLARSFVPVAGCSLTEQETIRQSVNQCQSGCATSTPSILMWPTIGGTPINEFTTEGYFSCAFPALFPTGAADYFKHLMMYDDSRFARHPRFRFFALKLLPLTLSSTTESPLSGFLRLVSRRSTS